VESGHFAWKNERGKVKVSAREIREERCNQVKGTSKAEKKLPRARNVASANWGNLEGCDGAILAHPIWRDKVGGGKEKTCEREIDSGKSLVQKSARSQGEQQAHGAREPLE